MNEPAAIQGEQAKWMEIILIWLGILIPIQTGPVLYRNLQWTPSTPELLLDGLGALLMLAISLGFLLKYQTLSRWILRSPSSNSETSIRDSNISGWLTIGIFTCGLLSLASAISLMLSLLGSPLSLWVNPKREALGMTEEKIAFVMTILALNHLPPLLMALSFTFFPQPLARWTISLQERWGYRKTETSNS